MMNNNQNAAGGLWGHRANPPMGQMYNQPIHNGLFSGNFNNPPNGVGRYNNYPPINQNNNNFRQNMQANPSNQQRQQYGMGGMNYNQNLQQRQSTAVNHNPQTGQMNQFSGAANQAYYQRGQPGFSAGGQEQFPHGMQQGQPNFPQGSQPGFLQNTQQNGPPGFSQKTQPELSQPPPYTFPLGDPQDFLNNQNQPEIPMSSGPVSFEAMDEKTKAEIRKLIAKKQDEQGIPLDQRKLPDSLKPITSGEMLQESNIEDKNSTDAEPYANSHVNTKSIIAELIQGEHNASKFYTSLSDMAIGRTKFMLNEIMLNCETRKGLLSSIYKNLVGLTYEEKNPALIKVTGLKSSIESAIDEESDSLSGISQLYDSIDSWDHLKKLNSVMHKKLIDINRLNTMSRRIHA